MLTLYRQRDTVQTMGCVGGTARTAFSIRGGVCADVYAGDTDPAGIMGAKG